MKRYKKNLEVIDSNIDDEVVAMNVDTGAYYGLDPIASVIWEVLSEPHTIDELVDKLTEKYDVAPEQCKDDSMPLIEQMVEAKLLELV